MTQPAPPLDDDAPAPEPQEPASVPDASAPHDAPYPMSPGGKHYERWWTPGVREPDPIAKHFSPALASNPATYAASRGLPAFVHPGSAKMDNILDSLAEIKDMLCQLSIGSPFQKCGHAGATSNHHTLDEFDKAISSSRRVTVALFPKLGSFTTLERLASWYVGPLSVTNTNPRGLSPQELEKQNLGHVWRASSDKTMAARWSEFMRVVRAIYFAARGGDVFNISRAEEGCECQSVSDDEEHAVTNAAFVEAARRIDLIRKSHPVHDNISVSKFMKLLRPHFGASKDH
jgi:hypothetical protein